MYIEGSYGVYLAVSVAITLWVARTLHQNGRVFLIDAFQGRAELSESVNRLLVVGFYLINLGYVTYALRTDRSVTTARQAIELVSDKLGMILLVLGAMHFFNLYIFNVLRKRGREYLEAPPLPPDARMAPPRY